MISMIKKKIYSIQWMVPLIFFFFFFLSSLVNAWLALVLSPAAPGYVSRASCHLPLNATRHLLTQSYLFVSPRRQAPLCHRRPWCWQRSEAETHRTTYCWYCHPTPTHGPHRGHATTDCQALHVRRRELFHITHLTFIMKQHTVTTISTLEQNV